MKTSHRLSSLFLLSLLCLPTALLSGCSQNSQDGSATVAASTVTFATGQTATRLLYEADFNDASYLNVPQDGLLFNHQKGIDSDGTNLVVADTRNNRVLIWHTAPTGNTPPNVVLGQPDFVQTDTNNASDPMAQLSWPIDVAVAGGMLFVSDTENDRILVWNSIPTTNQQPADFSIESPDIVWPWGIWAEGTKLMVASTLAGKVLLWNTLPTTGQEPPDLVLTSGGEMGTPRNISSDGSGYLMVADHNPTRPGQNMDAGTFYWSTFPTTDVSADGYLQEPASSFWMVGAPDSMGRLWWLAQILYRFDTTPIVSSGGVLPGDYNPDLAVDQYYFNGGDGNDMVMIGNRIYISLTNQNKIVGFSSLPTTSADLPDFVIGSNSLGENESSLQTRLDFLTNPVPVTDGQRLIVASDFDREIRFYDTLPTSNNAPSDFRMSFAGQPSSLSLAGGALLAFERTEGNVRIWDPVPTAATDLPTRTYTGLVPTTDDVAMDATHLFVLENNTLSVWNTASSYPAALATPDAQISLLDTDTLMGTAKTVRSDGTHLLLSVPDRHFVLVYDLATVLQGGNTAMGRIGGNPTVQFNLPGEAILSHGKVFVADTAFHRVQVWDSLDDALAGLAPAAILGQADANGKDPKKARDGLFQPTHLAFDGTNLWVGEFKFSGRLLEYVGIP
ncbi:MAG TPA: hypothetical protein ENI85_05185 [Deltaproteobacteria bacterium]|nr:hypothetical protein [Deltaproteobacteria bacterium]